MTEHRTDAANGTGKRVAIVTGASRGLGLELTKRLVADGWHVIADARGASDLRGALAPSEDRATAVAGDVTDPAHRTRLVAMARERGQLGLLVNNASSLGTTPLPELQRYSVDDLREVYETNVFAPLALIQACLPALRASGGAIVNICLLYTSDAA